jgi:hypothetical protein
MTVAAIDRLVHHATIFEMNSKASPQTFDGARFGRPASTARNWMTASLLAPHARPSGSTRGLFVSTLSSQKRTVALIERLLESDEFSSLSRTLCGVRVLAKTRRSNGAPHAWTTRRPTRFDPTRRRGVSGLPRNNHGFADRTACCPRRVGDSHLYVPEMRPEQDQGGSVRGRAAGRRIVVVRRRQRRKRRRASWQASSPGKHTRQTCGLSA